MGAAASSTVGVLLPMAALLFTVVLLSKEYWEDKAFPHYHIEGAVWKPISRVYPTWPLYCEDEDQFKYSVIQGRLGNCSLVACIAAVGEFPSVVKALVAEHENGRYTVRLGGDESDAVEVDEYIPFFSASSKPCFVSSSSSEKWPMLVEKAVAKKYSGSSGPRYDVLQAIPLRHALKVVFNCPDAAIEDISLGSSGWSSWCRQNPLDSIIFYDSQGYLMLCARLDSTNERGLYGQHAYTILQARSICVQCCADALNGCWKPGHTTIRLFQVRNPHGQGEWTDAWSDDSEMWERYGSVRELLEPQSEDDGVFWMEGDALRKYFQTVVVLKRCMT